jgi:signal transduction histidine kinase
MLWALVLLLIGIWWGYLIFNFDKILSHADKLKISKMLMWEGGSFITLLLFLSVTIFFLFVRDQNKTKSLQAFFASLTHELKTPLASIRLQGDVIHEILSSRNDPTLNKLIDRLIEDTSHLETQMDKILQLSRIERGGELNIVRIDLFNFIKTVSSKMKLPFEVTIESEGENYIILADEFALELILKNLFENTRVHTQSKKASFKLTKYQHSILLTYTDEGMFEGEVEKLGSLFYKFKSTKGSGIGLYLISKLVKKMHGSISLSKKPYLEHNLTFKSIEDQNA